MLTVATTPTGTRVIDAVGNAAIVPPIIVNSYSSLTVPAYWRAINFIAENLASFPRSVRRAGAIAKPDDKPHALDKLLRRKPNRYQNPTVFWRTFFAQAAHSGNAYARIERDRITGRAVALHNLAPHDVYPFRYIAPGATTPDQYYAVYPGPVVLSGADVLHVQGLSYDGMSGIDPVALHSETLQRASTLDRYQTKYLQKGTVIRGAIEFPATVSPERLTQIRQLLREHFIGQDGDEDVLLLTDGAKLNNTTLSPQESQLVEQGALSTKQIAQITGVPPEFLFELSEAKYNASVEQAGQNVVRYTFRPWIEQIEDELTVKLLDDAEQDAGYSVGINPDALLRGDTATQATTVIATTNAGLRSINEGRALLGLPRSGDADADKLSRLGNTTPATAGTATPPPTPARG